MLLVVSEGRHLDYFQVAAHRATFAVRQDNGGDIQPRRNSSESLNIPNLMFIFVSLHVSLYRGCIML